MNKIKDWLHQFGAKIRDLLFRLYKRSYGMDDINKTLLVVSLILSLLASFTGIYVLSLISTITFVYLIFRYFSSNKVARIEENRKFRKATKYFRLSWEYRKTHRIYKCKSCGQYIRVPKGQGKIETTCPTCGKKEVHIS